MCPVVGHSDWPAGVAGGAAGGQLQEEQHAQDEERQQQEDVHLHGPIILRMECCHTSIPYPKIVSLMVKIPVKIRNIKLIMFTYTERCVKSSLLPFYQCSGSVIFWYGSRSGSLDPYTRLTAPDPDPALSLSDWKDGNKKLVFFLIWFTYYFLKENLNQSSKIKSQVISEIKIFNNFFAWWWKDPDPNKELRSRIQKAQKHTDPTDPAPEHCFLL